MSKESKSAKKRMKAATETVGGKSSLNTKNEQAKVSLKDMVPGSAKVGLMGAAFYGSHLNHQTEKLRKSEEKFRKWSEDFTLYHNGNDAFGDTYHKIMERLKREDLQKKKIKHEKALQRHQKLWQTGIGAAQGVGRLADTTTRKTAYSQMTGRTSDIDVPTLQAQDTIPSYDY